jgi:hypothetical protein
MWIGAANAIITGKPAFASKKNCSARRTGVFKLQPSINPPSYDEFKKQVRTKSEPSALRKTMFTCSYLEEETETSRREFKMPCYPTTKGIPIVAQ